MHCTAENISIMVGSPIRQCCFSASVTCCPFGACSTLAPLFSVLTLCVIFASSLSSHNLINNPYSTTSKGICSCCFPVLEGPLWSLLTILPFRSSLASSSTDWLSLWRWKQWRKKNMDFGIRIKWDQMPALLLISFMGTLIWSFTLFEHLFIHM